MTSYVYLLSYNPMMPALSPAQIHAFIEQHRDIRTWYIPFSGTYVIKSELALVTLVEPFRRFFGPNLFILTYVNRSLIGGSLPNQVWDWINEVENNLLSSK